MTLDSDLDSIRLNHLNTMKTAFVAGQYQETLEALKALGELKAIRSGIRVEAVCIAARAHMALGKKKEARQLLQQVWEASLKNHRLYRHVAIACLELGEYRRAVSLVEKAAELSDAAHAKQAKPSQ
jgi:tetratricopeptide (TPR) repeat protein